jgi:hypothetical protein
MKTVTQNNVLETLSRRGGKIRWDAISAKAHLLSSAGEVIGAIRFDTFLRITSYTWIERAGSDYSYEYYSYKAR